MLIRDLFPPDRQVDRDIAPVVYFHDDAPERLAQEVSEYIITGGWPEGSAAHARLPRGIHEEYVGLIREITRRLIRPEGAGDPASWISGFYGSGKSSFAKFLGMALDSRELPGGGKVAEAWLAQDRSPRKDELHEAWAALMACFSAPPMSVVFDVGGRARTGESIHSVIVRAVQDRLGYCPTSAAVAATELKLQEDGHWATFLTAAREKLGRPWSEIAPTQLAEDRFSELMHHMFPTTFDAGWAWADKEAGRKAEQSAEEAVRSIVAMLKHQAPGRTLFVVVDEVSQYVQQDTDRYPLQLQSFVSELNRRTGGKVWLLVTGQEQLDQDGANNALGKMKDRFPPELRVHLSPTNIRDVVHQRLLSKAPAGEQAVRALFRAHRLDLGLYAYEGDRLNEEDFTLSYPLLPGQFDLLLRITSAIRRQSTRAHADDHAMRGLLQLLGELFRARGLADREAGALVTLDEVYEVQQTALGHDLQESMGRIRAWCEEQQEPLAWRAARAVVLLERLQDEEVNTTVDLVTRCLYDHVGAGNRVDAVRTGLEALRQAGLLGHSEKKGYRIQSAAGEDWNRERDRFTATWDDVVDELARVLDLELADVVAPAHKGRSFPILGLLNDGRHAVDRRVRQVRDRTHVAVDLRMLAVRETTASLWVRESDSETLRDRILWVARGADAVDEAGRKLVKSRKMLGRYEPLRTSLDTTRLRLLGEEAIHAQELDGAFKEALREAWMDGTLYYRSQPFRPRDLGATFGSALNEIGVRVLGDLYPSFVPIRLTAAEIEPLLDKGPDGRGVITGPDAKLLDSGLGILSLDDTHYEPTCQGAVPQAILGFVRERRGVAGATLLDHFAGPPYGWTTDLVRACLAGLLRGRHVRFELADGTEISRYTDPDVRRPFTRDGDLRSASIAPGTEPPVNARVRQRLKNLFGDHLHVDIGRDEESLADAIFTWFPKVESRLREVEQRLAQLAGSGPELPALEGLRRALAAARKNRRVEPTLQAAARHLDALADGLALLDTLELELTADSLRALREMDHALHDLAAQLEEHGGLDAELSARAGRLREHLSRERPWKAATDRLADVTAIGEAYRQRRRGLLTDQGAAAEDARARIKGHPDFDELTGEQRNHVLWPITEVLRAWDPDGVAPALSAIAAEFQVRLASAFDEALSRLEAFLEERNRVPIKVVALGVAHRLVKSEAELEALLEDVRAKVGPHLATGMHVRIK